MFRDPSPKVTEESVKFKVNTNQHRWSTKGFRFGFEVQTKKILRYAWLEPEWHGISYISWEFLETFGIRF